MSQGTPGHYKGIHRSNWPVHAKSQTWTKGQGDFMGPTQAHCIRLMAVCLGLFLGLLGVGAGPVCNALTSFCKFVPNAGLPCPNLIQGEELSPPSACYAMFC